MTCQEPLLWALELLRDFFIAVGPVGKSVLRPFSLCKDSSSGSIVTTDTNLALKNLGNHTGDLDQYYI